MNSAHPGDVHYFANEDDITEFLSGFSLISQVIVEHHWQNRGRRQFSSYRRIVASRVASSRA
jgi:hypothetical protein